MISKSRAGDDVTEGRKMRGPLHCVGIKGRPVLSGCLMLLGDVLSKLRRIRLESGRYIVIARAVMEAGQISLRFFFVPPQWPLAVSCEGKA